MSKLAANDILPSIYQFLLSCGFKKSAVTLQRQSGYDKIDKPTGLGNKGLLRVCKYYAKNHPEVLEEIIVEEPKPEEDGEEEEEEVIVVKPNKSSKKDGKTKKSKKVSDDEEESEASDVEAKKKVKKDEKEKKAKKSKKETDMEEESEAEEDFVPQKKIKKEEPKTKEAEKKGGIKNVSTSKSKFMVFEDEDEDEGNGVELKAKSTKTKQAVKTPAVQEEEEEEEEIDLTNAVAPEKPAFFSRTDYSNAHMIKHELRDNTFDAKYKFGQGGDDYGKIGWEKLKDTRGRDFKKEKTKLKNKNFAGGDFKINTSSVNSIKF